jgi:benzoyl-CoA reductase/2-hydroxyglutaryl-CoA dehydratase subunit BcrC/BadD/HgdB
MAEHKKRIGFTCAYTPLALIDASGFTPYRILPLGDMPDRAGSLLHDNMCPHVMRVLDRALAGNLPGLSGLVFMNSCDAMRRLSDAWRVARPEDRQILLDLPVADDPEAVAFFAKELERLAAQLAEWGGQTVTEAMVLRGMGRYDDLALGLERLAVSAARGSLPGGRPLLQEMLNRSVTAPPEETLAEIRRLETDSDPPRQPGNPDPADSKARPALRAPLFLFGNVLANLEAFELIESCGAQVVGDDLCTGSRQIVPLGGEGPGDAFHKLARGLLSRAACARTIRDAEPRRLAEQIVRDAGKSGARGVVGHVMKFCDPYLARLPAIRRALREAGLPLLILEGDCTMRSLGQYRTRIEAFVEMLGAQTS